MNKAAGFQFKQFYIEHSQVAMKVGTDSIILGSWLNVRPASKILDVGTGSGLLAIMLAQKSPECCQIVGIDIEPGAIRQARANADACPWPNKLSFVNQPFQTYQVQGWDLIVSNPPYFPAGQQFESTRQAARHNQHLGYAELVQHSATLLHPDGHFACILPDQFSAEVIDLANQNGLFLSRRLLIRASSNKPVIRSALLFATHQEDSIEQELTIHTEQGRYSADYKTLCKDYYLNF